MMLVEWCGVESRDLELVLTVEVDLLDADSHFALLFIPFSPSFFYWWRPREGSSRVRLVHFLGKRSKLYSTLAG